MRTVDNVGGECGLPSGDISSIEFMKYYDRMSPKLRKLLQLSPIKIELSNPELVISLDQELVVENIKNQLNIEMKSSTKDTYGEDHPQAGGYDCHSIV